MAETYSVPQTSGQSPSDDPPRNCGFQVSEKKKSLAGYSWKKCQLSTTSEATIPAVVSTATSEASINSTITNRSVAFLARNSGLIRLSPNPSPTAASTSAATVIA